MAFVPPSAPPQTADEHARYRVNVRVLQIALSTLTIGITAWLWMIHPVIGLAAAFLAKHVLVAILAAGLNLPIGPAPKVSDGK